MQDRGYYFRIVGGLEIRFNDYFVTEVTRNRILCQLNDQYTRRGGNNFFGKSHTQKCILILNFPGKLDLPFHFFRGTILDESRLSQELTDRSFLNFPELSNFCASLDEFLSSKFEISLQTQNNLKIGFKQYFGPRQKCLDRTDRYNFLQPSRYLYYSIMKIRRIINDQYSREDAEIAFFGKTHTQIVAH